MTGSNMTLEDLEEQMDELETKNADLQEQLDQTEEDYNILDDQHSDLKSKWDTVESLITDLYHEI